MGWFRKERKIDEEVEIENESIVQNEVNSIQVENDNEFLIEETGEEVEQNQEEIKTKTKSFESISKKLASVKAEYDVSINELMLSKKELNQKKKELDSVTMEYSGILSKIKSARKEFEFMNLQFKQKESKIDELSNVNSMLPSIKAEITKKKIEYETIKKQVDEIRKILNDMKSRQKTQLESKKNESGISEKEEKFIQKELLSLQGTDTQPIVKAASAVVSSMNQKLLSAQRELENVKKILDKERKEHEITKKSAKQIKSKSTD